MNLKKVRFGIFVIFVMIIIALIFVGGYLGYNGETIKDLLGGYSLLAPLLYILIIAVAASTALPVTAAVVPGVLLFSFPGVLIYTMIGTLIAGIFLFYFARMTGKDAIDDYVALNKGKLRTFHKFLHERSLGIVILLNTVYVFPSYIGSIVAGVSKIKLWVFAIVNLLTNFVNTFFIILFFYSVIHKIYAYSVVSVIGIVLVSLATILYYRQYFRDMVYLAFGKKTYTRIKKIKKKLD